MTKQQKTVQDWRRAFLATPEQIARQAEAARHFAEEQEIAQAKHERDLAWARQQPATAAAGLQVELPEQVQADLQMWANTYDLPAETLARWILTAGVEMINEDGRLELPLMFQPVSWSV